MKFHPDKCNVLRVTNKTKKIEANYHLHGVVDVEKEESWS
jgi:hypothetical protein